MCRIVGGVGVRPERPLVGFTPGDDASFDDTATTPHHFKLQVLQLDSILQHLAYGPTHGARLGIDERAALARDS
jgi:hypothetical protein